MQAVVQTIIESNSIRGPTFPSTLHYRSVTDAIVYVRTACYPDGPSDGLFVLVRCLGQPWPALPRLAPLGAPTRGVMWTSLHSGPSRAART